MWLVSLTAPIQSELSRQIDSTRVITGCYQTPPFIIREYWDSFPAISLPCFIAPGLILSHSHETIAQQLKVWRDRRRYVRTTFCQWTVCLGGWSLGSYHWWEACSPGDGAGILFMFIAHNSFDLDDYVRREMWHIASMLKVRVYDSASNKLPNILTKAKYKYKL